MILLGLSLLSGLVVFASVNALFGSVAATIPAILVAVGFYFVAARKVAASAQQAMMAAVSEIQKGRVERGIALLQEVKKKYARWQFFTASSIDGQIGSVYFMRQEFAKAKPFLEKSFAKHWNARAMLGVLAFRKKEYSKMNQIFEHATRYSPKQGLLWSVWAYCSLKSGNLKKSIDILIAGQKKMGDSDRYLIANLRNLQNNKKMKMNGYGQEWYQFHLEPMPQMKAQGSRQVRYVRRK